MYGRIQCRWKELRMDSRTIPRKCKKNQVVPNFQSMTTAIINQEETQVFGNQIPGITEMVNHVAKIVGDSRFIYKKSRYERGRARDIAEMRSDWGEFCRKNGITKENLDDTVAWFIRTSHTPYFKFEKKRITNCETFWRHWADVYNIAIDIKEAQNKTYFQSQKKPLSIKATL